MTLNLLSTFHFLLLSLALAVQWPSYPSPGVPRLADGKPDLTAPAPRTADGKPDLSGIWNYAGILGFRGRPPDPPQGTPPQATFWNIEAGFKEGLPFRPWAAELRKQRMAAESKDNPDASCLPLGHMQLHTHSQPRKIVQTKDLIVIIYEANAGVRQIFMDGRPAPGSDQQPWWFGYARGWWEGDTLVVETINFNGYAGGLWALNRNYLEGTGETLKVIERFKRVDEDSIDYQFTIDDPKTFTRSWTGSLPMTKIEGPIFEYACHEGNYAMTSILAGARAQEKKATEEAAKKKPQ